MQKRLVKTLSGTFLGLKNVLQELLLNGWDDKSRLKDKLKPAAELANRLHLPKERRRRLLYIRFLLYKRSFHWGRAHVPDPAEAG